MKLALAPFVILAFVVMTAAAGGCAKCTGENPICGPLK